MTNRTPLPQPQPQPLLLALLLAAVTSDVTFAQVPAAEPVASPSAVAQAVREREADVNTHQLGAVMDAPWRVQVRASGPNYVPVLFFFPETKADWREIKVLSMRISEVGSQGQSLLFEDTSAGKPVVGSSQTSPFTGQGLTVVNAWGETSTDLDVVRDQVAAGSPEGRFRIGNVNDGNRGWHIIFRLPVPATALAGGNGQLSLMCQVEYKRLDDPFDTRVHTVRKKLEVGLDSRPLPNFPGWWAYDTHVHTLAEWSADLSVKAIRKAFGGPVQMFRECARSIGLIESDDQFRDGVINTDHNTFFSDREFVRCGPTVEGLTPTGAVTTDPTLNPYFIDLKGKPVPEGQREFENYLGIFGFTFGEEITLHKSGGFFNFISGTLGSHLLAYSTRHFMGPFHGGRFLVFRDEPNGNTLEHVLSLMATDPRFPRGFCYAAHPFSDSKVERNFLSAWNDEQVDTAIRGAFIRKIEGKEHQFVFKGFELWNEKMSRKFASTTIDPQRITALLEDPTSEAAWRNGNPNWDADLNFGLVRFHQAIADSLSVSAGANPQNKFIRKFYISAGTDAHGDFNRNSDMLGRGLASLPMAVLKYLKVFSVSDNAFGKLRTVVEANVRVRKEGTTSPAEALDSFACGRSLVTDGPVLELRVDAEGRYDAKTRRWHNELAYQDDDGQIGGAGAMDGGRTMLVPEGGRGAIARYRFDTSPTFGGELERIELYRTEAGGKPKLVKVQRNTGEAEVLEAQGQLDPRAPADAGGWRTAPLAKVIKPAGSPPAPTGPVRALSAFSLGGFTRRVMEPPYDYRCYTNPVWAVPVKLAIAGNVTVRPIPAKALTITLRFPLSMSPTACDARLVPLDAAFNSTGGGSQFLPIGSAGGWAGNPRQGVPTSVLTLTNPEPIDVPPSGAWCLSVDGLQDTHGNALNSVAWRLDLAPQGLVVAP